MEAELKAHPTLPASTLKAGGRYRAREVWAHRKEPEVRQAVPCQAVRQREQRSVTKPVAAIEA